MSESISDLLPCPFCGQRLDRLSNGMLGQPRHSHRNDSCPIGGHIMGGEDFADRWNRPPNVTVKQLKWLPVTGCPSTRAEALCAIGSYRLADLDGSGNFAVGLDNGVSTAFFLDEAGDKQLRYQTIEAAKDAAQADYEERILFALETGSLKAASDHAATWRDINCRVVDWVGLNDHFYRGARAVSRLCRTEHDPWWSLTLGDVADMGERRWRHMPFIGDKAVLVIKRTIDLAAEGKMVTAKAAAADAYIPTCERDKENNQ